MFVLTECLDTWRCETAGKADERKRDEAATREIERKRLSRVWRVWTEAFKESRRFRFQERALAKAVFGAWRDRAREARRLAALMKVAEAHHTRRSLKLALFGWNAVARAANWEKN